MKKYSQLTAMLAISKASFRSITRSPSAVVFTLLFPLIFILVFGFLGGNGITLELGIHSGSDGKNEVYDALKNMAGIKLIEDKSDDALYKELEKGRIDAVLNIRMNPDAEGPRYFLDMQTSEASMDKGSVLQSVMENLVNQLNLKDVKPAAKIAELRQSRVKGRKYSMIDFILPGQLGFSILSTGVFGTAFVFFNLRQTLVIKRFFATPIRKPFIIMGEALSRLVFSMLGAIFIIAIGYFAFGFTLVNGFITALTMLSLAAIGLIVFMGFGFIISGLAKNESMIPPLANIVTLPQFLLSGTFFPIESFPSWLQPVCKALPLTYLNDALRKVAFEGAGFTDISSHLLVMLLWGVIAYALATRFFRWE
ncbi:MAG: ABC transporter permease [Bacteroidia bacterium]|nr:ABC transporter permease [Bacteroidia bacterium]